LSRRKKAEERVRRTIDEVIRKPKDQSICKGQVGGLGGGGGRRSRGWNRAREEEKRGRRRREGERRRTEWSRVEERQGEWWGEGENVPKKSHATPILND